MSKILIATTNKGKTEKMKKVLEGLSLEYLTLDNIDKKVEINEIGKTFEENAALKAISWSSVVNHLAIATDAGVVIPSLGKNWDGLLTHRFAGKQASAADKLETLLSLMKPFEDEKDRTVCWHESFALAKDGKLLAQWTSTEIKGIIAKTYDPKDIWEEWWLSAVWYSPQFGKVYSRLNEEEKSREDKNWNFLTEKLKEYFKK